jgi:lipopolysaccharide/colanic/teichoic acid biosynthesis glycosyltransferase
MDINFFKKLTALTLLTISTPILLLIYLAVKLTSKGPFIFVQRRAGKGKRPFYFYKIRTMVVDAERLKKSVYHLNEADGPVFKIRHDPRYTGVGKFLSHSGLDELPQLINIIKGEMDFVGPRPLPVTEAQKVPAKYKSRFDVLPGMTSPWIVEGAHSLSFAEWMKLDIEYAKNKNIFNDVKIFTKTLFVIMRLIIRSLLKK